MSNSYSSLRRTLAGRLNMWGGDISSNGSGRFSSNGTSNTAVDITRPEPDEEWDESWIVINPGSSDQVNSPTTWRRIAAEGGWIQSNGTFTINGVWPTPYTNGPVAGTLYEVYKVFKPENWLQAVNWALANSYPERHLRVTFEVPMDVHSRVIDWGQMVKSLQTSNPTSGITPVPNSATTGTFQTGVYSFAYSYDNDLGETLISPVTTFTVLVNNSSIDVPAITGVPASAAGVNYYCSLQSGSTQLGLLSIGEGVLPVGTSASILVGMNNNGTVNAINFPDPPYAISQSVPDFNTTNIDNLDLRTIELRMNPGQFPEIWNTLAPDYYKPLGATTIQLQMRPISAYNLRFICTSTLPLLSSEVDTCDEPTEIIYAGAEYYLWNLLAKTSTIVNVNWEKLAQAALVQYKVLKNTYALDAPRETAFKPTIRVIY